MRLLQFDSLGTLSLTKDFEDRLPAYAILSHTWGHDQDEVHFDDLKHESFKNKPGYHKIRFCGEQAKKDGLEYFWVDTCCINKADLVEYSEAINSMFRWYQAAAKCYVYMFDVSVSEEDLNTPSTYVWTEPFMNSRWFRRGWTLQELLAPTSVDFFSSKGTHLGDKKALEQLIHQITDIPITALRGESLSQFSVNERMRWAAKRVTKRKEDEAYCLMGIFGVFIPPIYGEREHALIRLRAEAEKLSGSECLPMHLPFHSQSLTCLAARSEMLNLHWVVPRSPNGLFTGRKDILDDLEAKIRRAIHGTIVPESCCFVISGMGGQGKSEISLQLAQRVRSMCAKSLSICCILIATTDSNRFWGVFWVDVSTPSLAENGFLEIATRLKLASPEWKDGYQALANTQQSWLLVLDNADDPNVDYQDYLPSGFASVVVLTSRNAECEQYATGGHIPLDGLPIEDAMDLLQKTANLKGEQHSSLREEARKVANLLQSHPLALIQAGSYIRRGHCTCSQYPLMYERQRKRLLGFHASQARSRYRDVYATLEASVETLESSQTQASKDALELLPLLAVCGPNQFPLSFFKAAWVGAHQVLTGGPDDGVLIPGFTKWHVSRLPSLMQVTGDSWDPFRLVESVNSLKELALVTTSSDDNQNMHISMHPLVHAWARDRQNEESQHNAWIIMGSLMGLSFNNSDLWDTHTREMQPHLQATVAFEMRCAFGFKSPGKVVPIVLGCWYLLHCLTDGQALMDLLERLCSHLGLDKFVVERQWVVIYLHLGWSSLIGGKPGDAVRVLEQVVSIMVASGFARVLLAISYSRYGRNMEALNCLDEAMQAHDQDPMEFQPGLQRLLAEAYLFVGRPQRAIHLLEKLGDTMNDTGGEASLAQLNMQQSFAMAYSANGRHEEAVELLQEVARIKQQTMAESDPRQSEAQRALAHVYSVNGQYQEAMELLQEVVRIQQQTLAESHPLQVRVRQALARVYYTTGQHQEAVELQQEVVRIQQQTLAESHPSLLSSQHDLGLMRLIIGLST